MQARIDVWIDRDEYEMPDEFMAVVNLFDRYKHNEHAFIKALAMLLVKENGYVTADDIFEVIDTFRKKNIAEFKADTRIIGTALGYLKNRGKLAIAGHIRTKRRSSHGRTIAVFTTPENKNTVRFREADF